MHAPAMTMPRYHRARLCGTRLRQRILDQAHIVRSASTAHQGQHSPDEQVIDREGRVVDRLGGANRIADSIRLGHFARDRQHQATHQSKPGVGGHDVCREITVHRAQGAESAPHPKLDAAGIDGDLTDQRGVGGLCRMSQCVDHLPAPGQSTGRGAMNRSEAVRILDEPPIGAVVAHQWMQTHR